ncbi:Sensory transduction protein regX3 [Paraburkholderia nemoris]|uniref:response regulator transcription factor n=1 Tax=Paraburkholderia nemoris TaxID=2793076 RepID=UPI00190A4D09|nr:MULTISPECIES: response regulator transcription factor [Paraburkholderia]MBK3786272.1 response regulator transcription factor [Paraburkholderia aspalathi]CAE6850183.1 Sensory transduction protein regX3 [Paraburkholderia nemoris]
MRIAILQRDPVQGRLLEKILVQAGHGCVVYDDGLSLSKALAGSTVDLLVLDWRGMRLPCADMLKAVRAAGGDRTPVIFASADVSEVSVVRAFAWGADDYIALPVGHAEFQARVAALLRRAYPADYGDESFNAGPYHFDRRRQIVTLRGTPVHLSVTQFRLASLFFSNTGRVLSRDHIFAMVWGRECREVTRTIDSHVSSLRRLLEIGRHNGFRLQAVYRSGYRLLQLHIDDVICAPRAAAA